MKTICSAFLFLNPEKAFYRIYFLIHFNVQNYFVARIAIPGSVFPSRNSKEAPPPVET